MYGILNDSILTKMTIEESGLVAYSTWQDQARHGINSGPYRRRLATSSTGVGPMVIAIRATWKISSARAYPDSNPSRPMIGL